MRTVTRIAVGLAAAGALVVALAGGPAGAATPAPTPTTASPTATGLCPDPGPAPSGATASARLIPPDQVEASISWTPLVAPSNCAPIRVEIEQIAPAGPTTTALAADGHVVLQPLRTLTAYTWRLRFVGGTVSEWATVSVGKVLPLDYCLGLPFPRPVVGTAVSPTSVHLEWGTVSYPAECSGNLTVQNVTAGTPAVTVSRSQTGITIDGLTPGSTNTWRVSFFVPLGEVTVTQPTTTPAGCTATLTVDNRWQGSFVASVVVRNTSARALSGWSVGIPMPTGGRIEAIWGADGSAVNGMYTARNASWNAVVAPDGSAWFGFILSAPGNAPAPTGLTCTPLAATAAR
jgi:cellulase/cellobiase CelA1